MVTTAIETGLRWGELIDPRPQHLEFTHGTLTVSETIVEIPLRAAPNGQRMVIKPNLQDNEPRTPALRLLEALGDHINERDLADGDLLFATREGPRSPATRSAAASGRPP